MEKNLKGKDGITQMAQNNDERIMTLKAQIEEKKKDLKNKKTKFSPETNCLIELDGVRYNLHTITDHTLLLKLNLLKMSAEDLELNLDEIVISGYPLSLWISDIKNKLEYEKYKAEKQKLDMLEKQLTNLLSDTKQTELKIDELAAMI